MKILLNALTIFLFALFISTSCWADNIHELFNAVSRKGDAQALIELKAEAEKGNSEAQEKLGYLYSSPNYPDKNTEKDEENPDLAGKPHHHKWHKHRQAFKDIIPQDYQEAMKWYQKAAAQGNVEAMKGIENLYENGLGMPKNMDEALKWYVKAAEKGDEVAITKLGWMYFYGQNGVKQDYAEAAKWSKLANSNGQMDYFAAIHLAQIYKDGLGVQKDPVEANYWVWKASMGSIQIPAADPQKVIDEMKASPVTDEQTVIKEVLTLPLTPEQKAAITKRIADEQKAMPSAHKAP